MGRQKFLMGLGILPFVSTSLFANNSAKDKKKFVLVGLGDSGDTLTREIQKMGFKGKVYDIQVAKADNLQIGLTERLLHGEEIAAKPNFLFSTFTNQKNVVTVFVSGLGGIRSTYLSALTYHEMTKLGNPFYMFLTTPFEFEGVLRNTRAKKFQLATEGDMAIKYINLNDCPRDIWPTVKQGFTKFSSARIYHEIKNITT
jgi:hypothetical protein